MISSQRQNGNLLSCFRILFDVEEFKIQEDFLQISELVYTENAFINRPTLIDSTNRSLSHTYLNVPDITEEEVLFYETVLTEYFGRPAVVIACTPRMVQINHGANNFGANHQSATPWCEPHGANLMVQKI